MRYLLVLLLVGCASAPAQVGNTCVEETSWVGRDIKNYQSGKIGKITGLHGRSEFCPVPQYPIGATVEYR